jgi:hypothetical protein
MQCTYFSNYEEVNVEEKWTKAKCAKRGGSSYLECVLLNPCTRNYTN